MTADGYVRIPERRHPPRVQRNLRRGPRAERWIRPRPRPPAPEAAPAPDGTLTEWHDMSPGERLVEWAQLRAWVTWLTDRYELTAEDRLPACWARHPGLAEELRALRAWRLEIYGGAAPQAGQAARYWHAELRQVLHAATTVYAAGCRAGHRGAPALVAGDVKLQSAWAEADHLAGTPAVEIEAGQARRSGQLASPEHMAEELDRGAAAQVAGLTDRLYCDGAWWTPASAGWIIRAPAQEADADADPDWAGCGFGEDMVRGSELWGR